MTGHVRSAKMVLSVPAGDTDEHYVSLQNKPEMPDVDGREDVPNALIPEFYDKEITRIRAWFAGNPGAAVDLPEVRLGPNHFSIQSGSPSNRGSLGSNAELQHESYWFSFIPDVMDSSGSEHFEIELDEPIEWPEMDPIHMVAQWNDGSHESYSVRLSIDWQPA